MVAGWGLWDGYLPFVDNFIRLDYVDGNKLSHDLAVVFFFLHSVYEGRNFGL